MLITPLSPLAHLFHNTILLRGFLLAIGLLGLLVGFYIWARSQTDVESISRAMLFTALVLSRLALIQLAGCLMIALISFCWFEGLKRL